MDVIVDASAIIAPLDAERARLAGEACRASGHPARLHLGDCFSYALAVASHEPLLFVGDDFARTDVESALA